MVTNKVILIGFLVLLSGHVIGQFQDFGKVIPPSPEPASLAKFTEVPVNFYTGLPQISIPLYSFNIEGVDVDVSLSYHARGIGVEELASWVGIGWALNAGGAVVRQTRGKPDDSGQGYLQDDFYKDLFSNSQTREEVYSKSLSNLIDIEPDKFSFNFLGYSGEFYFDQQKKDKVLQEQFSDLDIQPIYEYSYRKILGWIIIAPNGFKYYFGLPKDQSEISRVARSEDQSLNFKANIRTNKSLDPSIGDVFNSWQLIDIESPTGKIVNFEYELEIPNFCRKSFDTVENGECTTYYSVVNSKQYLLKSIAFEGEVIHFYQSETIDGNIVLREDLLNGHSLRMINVVNSQGKVIKEYKLYYSYSNDELNKNVFNVLLTNDPCSSKRMFLDSLKECSGSECLPAYVFSYINKEEMPNRFSTAQDFWGYYNGEDNGNFLNFYNESELGDDKAVNPVKSQVGLLNRIVYPTGGSTDYIYEANKAVPPSYYSTLEPFLFNPTEPKYIRIMKNPDQYNSSLGKYISDNKQVVNPIHGYLHVNSHVLGDERYDAKLIPVDNTSTSNIPLPWGINDIIADGMVPGTYRIEVTPRFDDDPATSFQNSFSVIVSWEEEIEANYDLMYCGGNRIKEIVNGSTHRTYEYTKNDELSSGKVFSLPCLQYASSASVDNSLFLGIRPGGNQLNFVQGNHMGYSTVKEYTIVNGEKKGKTQYYYTSMNDEGSYWDYPYVVSDNNEQFRGKLLRVDYYKWSASHDQLDPYSLIKREDYTYNVYGNLIYSASGDPILMPPLEEYQNDDKMQFCLPLIVFTAEKINTGPEVYEAYFLRGGTMQLVNKQITDFYDDINVSTFFEYEYDNDDNYQLKHESVTTSSGELINTYTYYPDDYNVFEYLLDQHIINKPIKIERFIGSLLNDGSVLQYNEGGQVTDIYKYDRDLNIISVGDHDPDVIVPEGYLLRQNIKYDNSNPIEVKSNTNSQINYIWGYNNRYPIAKIENATYQQILAKVDTSEIHSLSNQLVVFEDYLRSKLDNLRSIEGAMVTTYTYNPLVGITSETDPNGITIYYEYDEFGRLELIKDHNGNVLKKIEYNYAKTSNIFGL